jgi:hypothetical protein
MSSNAADPFDVYKLSKDLLTAQQKFTPSTLFFGPVMEATRILTNAQLAYWQAVMRANAALYTPMLVHHSAPERPERPSVSARESGFSES